jgi:hypothetical protein
MWERSINKSGDKKTKKKERRKTGKRTKKRNAGPKKSTSSRMLGLAFPDIPKSRIRKEGQRWRKRMQGLPRKREGEP